MAEPNTVTLEELREYIARKQGDWQRFATSSNGKSIKILEFNADGLYRVIADHDRLIYLGGVPDTAVREYNALL